MKQEGKKEIIYRGGLVRFFIPDHWVEEYEEKGGGTFYDPDEETATLRLNVLSFISDSDVPPNNPLKLLRERSVKYSGLVEELPGNRYLLKYKKKVEENEESLVIYYWEVAKMLSVRDYDIAVFSFTILKSEDESGIFQTDILEIEKDIKHVTFSNLFCRT